MSVVSCADYVDAFFNIEFTQVSTDSPGLDFSHQGPNSSTRSQITEPASMLALVKSNLKVLYLNLLNVIHKRKELDLS